MNPFSLFHPWIPFHSSISLLSCYLSFSRRDGNSILPSLLPSSLLLYWDCLTRTSLFLILKKLNFFYFFLYFKLIIFLVFSNHFYVLISKIILKNKKNIIILIHFHKKTLWKTINKYPLSWNNMVVMHMVVMHIRIFLQNLA